VRENLIVGLAPSVWGEAVGMNVATACGYLAACMDALADFYVGPTRRGRIRAVEFEPAGVRDAAN
jgi:hypothetical protein